MANNMLKSNVTDAVSLDGEINEKTNRLNELKAELVTEARSREDKLASTDGGGMRWIAECSDGCIVRVSSPAPALKAKSMLATKLQLADFDISRGGVSKIEARLRFVDDKTSCF